MKLNLGKKCVYYLVLFISLGLNQAVFAQDEVAEEPDDCWCKYVEQGETRYNVYNVDSMIQKGLRGWRNLIDCGCEDCEGRICTFEKWECNGEECSWVERTGTCTDEVYGSDIPWEGDGNGECNCINVYATPNYTFYTNISAEVASQNPDEILQYKIIRPCVEDSCGSNKCIYTITNMNNHTTKVKEGECMEGWSAQKGRNMLLDAEGNEVQMDVTLKFYPNPANEQLTIESPTQAKTTIFSLNGQIILESPDKKIDISHLTAGVYIVIIETENGAFSDQLIVE